MCNNENDGCKCIAEILTVINILQEQANQGNEASLETCDRGFLGCGVTAQNCNTRPVMLFTVNNIAWTMPINKENNNCNNAGPTSCVFRVEKIDGCCATFRVLAPNPNTEDVNIPYIATNSFFTMNLNCVCAVRCLPDTFVECI